MLRLDIVLEEETFDEKEALFLPAKTFPLELEHSLVSLSKWESREEKPFLGKEKKTDQETLAYVKDMAVEPNVPHQVFEAFTNSDLLAVNNYISAKMTATWIREVGPQRHTNEVITAELIYYWMIAMQIPFECQHWHLNRLLTLIRVCNEKNKPSKKMDRKSAQQQQRQLNAQRRARLGTRG